MGGSTSLVGVISYSPSSRYPKADQTGTVLAKRSTGHMSACQL